MTRTPLTLLALTLALTAGSAASAGEALDLQYARRAGVDPALNRLDVYSPDAGRDLPVIVFVHGGGWKGGDKRNLRASSTWLAQVQRRQHVLVGVNFRLWTNRVGYREQVTDIAAALRWVHDRISSYRGSNKKVFLLGHSSGAHLVSLLGTDPDYLRAERLPLSFLKGVIPFDVPAYDIPLAIRSAPALGWPEAVGNLREIFTRSRPTQEHASPVTHLRRSRAHPPFHVVYAPTKDGRPQRLTPALSAHFVRALQGVGVRANLRGYANETHASLAADFGDPRDLVTQDVETFIDGVLARSTPLAQTVRSIVGPLVDPTGRRADTAPGMAVAVLTSSEASVVGLGATRLNGRAQPNGRTTFGIASVSKALTGLMLADEVSNGGLRRSDSAARYLGNDLRLNRAITLEHLVTHRSGLVNFPTNLVDRNGDGVRDANIPLHSPAADYTRQDLSRGIAANAAPNQRYAYSNLGAGLAALALRDHLGLPSFDAVLQRRLVTPLGLSATGTNTPRFVTRVQPQSATGYMRTQRGLQAVPFSDMGVLAGSGEVITCGDDMLRVLRTLTGLGRSPLANAAQEATRSLAVGGRGKRIGYAIDIEGSGANAVYSKSGSCAGYTAYLIFRRSNPPVGVVVMVNRGGLRLAETAKQVLDALAVRAQ